MNYHITLIFIIILILFYICNKKNKNEENYDLIDRVRRGLGQTL